MSYVFDLNFWKTYLYSKFNNPCIGQIPIPFPQSTEIYLTAISIVVAIVFEKQIQEFVEHKNGRLLKFVALMIAIGFVFFTSLIIFAILNFAAILASLFFSVLRIGNNYGTVFYTFGIFILLMKPFLDNRTNERFDKIWTFRELLVTGILFLLGCVYNNLYL